MKIDSFERFLLFHPQSNLTYIRKLSMSYGYDTALAVVNDNDRVTHIGVSNHFDIISFDRLSDEDKSILGSERCSSLQGDDLLSIYRINKALKLKDDYKLWRPCRNMRYTTLEETVELKNLMKHTLISNNLVFEEKNSSSYNTAYSDNVELDLENIDLTTELNSIELPSYDSLNATGQTRLI